METVDASTIGPKPEILAPAGDTSCFLAALAAGSDAIYAGLKNFSARMEAANFGIHELSRLTELAHGHACRVYVPMNNLVKERELSQAYRLVKRLSEQVRPDGLIIQDLAMVDIARQAGFMGAISFSTLANISDPEGLAQARALGANRVILPRELSLDEMREMGASCPPGLSLECFVHGALCYCVSGRCYWSSYMGGKSGLRGRCVQPCRRMYSRKAGKSIKDQEPAKAGGERLFSCQDLELLPLVRQLATVPNLVAWKIEGRKKGPHYVFHAVTAYRLLRDYPDDSAKRKMAQEILDMALGRPGVRARFLPQKKYQPMAPHGQTSSGLQAGKMTILQNGSITLKTRIPLLPGDLLRVGVEDERWHFTFGVTRAVPKAGSLPVNVPRHKTPRSGTPVYLIDRREPEFEKLLARWKRLLAEIPAHQAREVSGEPKLPAPCTRGKSRPSMYLTAGLQTGKSAAILGKGAWQALWLGQKCLNISRTLYDRIYFWLPPAIWPDNADNFARLITALWKRGARHFVCNAPWQRGFFPEQLPHDADLTGGPFCNLANALALEELSRLGFCAAFASPELSWDDLRNLAQAAPIPLGMVLGGAWPVGVSRFGLVGMESKTPFFSPRREAFWSLDRQGLTWIYPAWEINLVDKREELEKAGFSFFAWMDEKKPDRIPGASRPGLFNWEGGLL